MTQSPDGVVWDQVSIPGQDGVGGGRVNTLSNSHQSLCNMMTDSLVIFLIDVEAVRQTGEKSFYNHIIHSQSGFQAPEDRWKKWRVKALLILVCECCTSVYCVCVCR